MPIRCEIGWLRRKLAGPSVAVNQILSRINYSPSQRCASAGVLFRRGRGAMILSRLKIATRIDIGFGSLMVLALLLAATGYSGIEGFGRQTVKVTGLMAIH